MENSGFDGFEWHSAKSESTYRERGLDFETAARVFEANYVEREDLRWDYGERRFIAVGSVDDVMMTVVWTPRGRNRRIISAWPSSARERREFRDYREALERGDPNG